MNVEPIFEPGGRVAGWLRSDVVFDRECRPLGFIRGGRVFDFAGTYRGLLDRGFFRDARGDAVAFVRDATGGPIPPFPEVPERPPAAGKVPPVPAVPPVLPMPPIPSLKWSRLSWFEFLTGS